ncbi:histidine phosphatase family protein [Gluconacetobacter azotocaptans]|uniref:Histidine phosphatase family protein n=1 Tax=Gluconacetobacter azotocaptans TaxID=142834 RepID=A0A7W4JUZ5_9PROT|nr:histidine phosphatase family protein [Gluconacetobacter azotocaptans]MBB2191395.1 histidine phosphatase family protein [Gluconacetobacter azotocaptans]MBM9403639.1 histidine phosphatase family protein [Gluconacetobacter azotocaptans]GBQ29177.1 phosphoglycerate mutase [Gluconacetobacter azotocaptans DSM 13594]
MTDLIARPYWYLRHGETDWNAEGRSQGRSDIPLNARGIAQAEAAGALLSRHEDDHMPVARIVSSPLVRALRTAQIVAQAMAAPGSAPLPVAVDDGLQEVCFGEQEGQPMGHWYDSWIAGEYTPQGAEPFAELRARAVAAVNRALDGHGVVLIVCHGAMFRALRAAMGLPPNVRLPNAVPLWVAPRAEEANGNRTDWGLSPLG